MKVSKKRFLKDLEESVELMKNGRRIPYAVLEEKEIQSLKDGVTWTSKMFDTYLDDECMKENNNDHSKTISNA